MRSWIITFNSEIMEMQLSSLTFEPLRQIFNQQLSLL